MTYPIYPTIKNSYKNDFKRLYEIIAIKMPDLPQNARYCMNHWACLVKTISVCVSVSRKNEDNYVVFEKFQYNIHDRFVDFEHHHYTPIYIHKKVCTFYLIPPQFIQRHHNLLPDLEKMDIDYKIDIDIEFNDWSNIILSTGHVSYANLEAGVLLWEENILIDHQNKKNNNLEDLSQKIENILTL